MVIVPHRTECRKVGTGIQKSSISCFHALQWTIFVCHHTDMAVAIVEPCMDEDRHWTLNRLPDCTGIYGSTLLQILQ
jgi:hypothetical protein